MARITRNDLEAMVNLLNLIAKTPKDPYRKEGDKNVANIGNYHLSGCYGGWALHQIYNDAGAIRDVFQCGHMPARELYEMIHAFRIGFETAKG
jgi:hypothetical protein